MGGSDISPRQATPTCPVMLLSLFGGFWSTLSIEGYPCPCLLREWSKQETCYGGP